jgi:predicted kinase
MLIILSGLPGTGKTTLARELGGTLLAVHVRVDSIEQAMRNAGWQVHGEGYAVAQAIAEDNLRLGHIVIADSVNPWPRTRDDWRAVAQRAEVGFVEVEVVCSDVDEHRRRVESRQSDIAGHRLPTWQEVLARDYHPWNRAPLIVDTGQLSVDGAVRLVMANIPSATTSRARGGR